MTRIPLWAGLLVLACAVVLTAGSASAKSAGNHSFWTDPPGDNQHGSTSGNYASDILSVDITSQDKGLVHIAVTLADVGRLVTGDALDVYIDYDRNRSTGDRNGSDLDLYAQGGPASTGTSFLLCRIGTLRSCEQGPSGWAHDQPSSTSGQHVVDFYLTMGVAAFDFFVQEGYTQPQQTNTLYDWAPDSGFLTYQTKADPDHDGFYGTADHCWDKSARPNRDKNHNGCPGPFGLIHEVFRKATTVDRPGYLHIVKAWIANVPPGSRVVFTSPYGGEGRRANSSGVAGSGSIRGEFRFGSVVGVRITKGNFVGVLLKTVAQRGGLATVRRLCLPATGGPPVRCSGDLKGL
jgi:hypothetical protein